VERPVLGGEERKHGWVGLDGGEERFGSIDGRGFEAGEEVLLRVKERRVGELRISFESWDILQRDPKGRKSERGELTISTDFASTPAPS